MNQQYRKKLIEVALPLEAINVASAREKAIRHGHPSTLHLWWARRPLAACRAVLFASLVDDPDSDPMFRKADGTVDEERAGNRRAELFKLIEELVKWENSNNEAVLNRARAEIAASVASRKILDKKEWTKDQTTCGEKAWVYVCRTAKPQSVNMFLAEHAPTVLDPFCGGGAIPLEAQRLGLRSRASDLNPVPVLITKALIETPARFAGKPPVNPASRKQGKLQQTWKGAQGLADDVRYYGAWMRDEAQKQIGHVYPKAKITVAMAEDRSDLKPYVGEALPVIAWLWARTVASPNPTLQGAHVPLVRSFWLCKKTDKEAWVQPVVDKRSGSYRFIVRVGQLRREEFDPGRGTVDRRGVNCVLTNQPIPLDHVRAEGRANRLGYRLMAIVAEGPKGRVYLPPQPEHEAAAASAHPSGYPDTQLPAQALGFRVQNYGLDHHYKLFFPRQLQAMVTFSGLVKDAYAQVRRDASDRSDAEEYAAAVSTYLAFAVDKLADLGNTGCPWEPVAQCPRNLFGRQTIPMNWNFAEGNPLGSSSGSFAVLTDLSVSNLIAVFGNQVPVISGNVIQHDAAQPHRHTDAALVCTDPPYYDNIGYADLSDFFYIWLRRSLGDIRPELFRTVLTPKSEEIIANPGRFNGQKDSAARFFEKGLSQAFSRMHEVQEPDFPAVVYYAFKQAEDDGPDEEATEGSSFASTGWETMLEGLIGAGFVLSGTWPVRTEGATRLRGMGSNALASSVAIVARLRPSDAPLATRREFVNALKRELPEALQHLQRGSIAPVDLAQAAIGPGMAVFTRYAKVMEADGSQMKVRQALSLINQMLDEVLAEQEGEFDADTRWALAWFEQFGVEEGQFGVAETLSKAKNTSIKGMEDAGILWSRGGKVRLLKRDELPADWNPATDTRLRHWEIVQHLIRTLESGGESAAADLLRRRGGMGEIARDLAYRLYNICERKGWASEALAYNGLVIAWPEITKLAQSRPAEVTTQSELAF